MKNNNDEKDSEMKHKWKEWLNNIDESIATNASFATVIIVVFLLLIVFMPYVMTNFSRISGIAENGNIGSNIGGITAPFVGILSALLVYVSFKAQVKANQFQMRAFTEQIENNKKDENLKFIYYRLTELQSLSKKRNTSANVQAISHWIKEMTKHLKNEAELREKIQVFRTHPDIDFILVERFINTIAVIQAMMQKIVGEEQKKQQQEKKKTGKQETSDDENNGFDKIQNDYIKAALRYEFYTVLNNFITENQLAINELGETCINKNLQGLEELFNLFERVGNVKQFVDQ